MQMPARGSGLPPTHQGQTHSFHGSLPGTPQRPHLRPQLLAGQPGRADARGSPVEVAVGATRGADAAEAEVEQCVQERHAQQQPHGWQHRAPPARAELRVHGAPGIA